MNLAEALTTLSDRIDGLNTDMDCVLKAFVDARDSSSDEEWDKWQDHPKLGILMDALSDLEFALEGDPDQK